MARKRSRQSKDAVDEFFEFLTGLADATGGADVSRDFRSAVHEAAAVAADALGFAPPKFAQDRGQIPPSQGVPRHGARYESIGPSHFLVMRIVNVDGRPKVEWKAYKADDPDVKPETFVDEYLADRSVMGILIFQGSLLFRDMRQFPGTGRGQDQ